MIYISYTLKNCHFVKNHIVGKLFTNGPGDMGSIPGCVILKTL